MATLASTSLAWRDDLLRTPTVTRSPAGLRRQAKQRDWPREIDVGACHRLRSRL